MSAGCRIDEGFNGQCCKSFERDQKAICLKNLTLQGLVLEWKSYPIFNLLGMALEPKAGFEMVTRMTVSGLRCFQTAVADPQRLYLPRAKKRDLTMKIMAF